MLLDSRIANASGDSILVPARPSIETKQSIFSVIRAAEYFYSSWRRMCGKILDPLDVCVSD